MFLRKGLLRPRTTILSYSKLLAMEKNMIAILLSALKVLQSFRRMAEAAHVIKHRVNARANRATIATTMLHMLFEWCPGQSWKVGDRI